METCQVPQTPASLLSPSALAVGPPHGGKHRCLLSPHFRQLLPSSLLRSQAEPWDAEALRSGSSGVGKAGEELVAYLSIAVISSTSFQFSLHLAHFGVHGRFQKAMKICHSQRYRGGVDIYL